MALSARISKRSTRGRCKCPSGTKKVFVGNSGIRCGKVKGSGRSRRFTFVKTPKTCNYLPAARKAKRARKGKSCKYGVDKRGKCFKSSHAATMAAARKYY